VVNYEGDKNGPRDRTDNSISAYLFYQLRPKTALFTEYKFVNVDYDLGQGETPEAISDSKNHFVYGGVEWAATEKSTVKLKVGYAAKRFADPTIEDVDNVVADLSSSYKLTESTSLTLAGAREIKETVTPGINYTIGHRLSCAYTQAITQKLSGNVSLAWMEDLNSGVAIGNTEEKKDTTYSVSPGLDYLLTERLAAGANYSYSKRDSNIDTSNYVNNTVMVRLSYSL
jgi:hypothetical protein